MLTADRQTRLLEILARDGRLVAADLAREFATSEDTIRRDLRALARAGRLTRVHGGALPASPTHVPLADRRGLQAEAKAALGRKGASLIQTGQTVILDGGTTYLELVRSLDPSLRATIVTHSPGIAAALEPFDGIEVIIVGGRLMRHSMVAVGAAARDTFARLRADLCFLGVTGVAAETGLTTGDAEEAALKAGMMRAAGETIVLATPDKIGAASAWGIAPLAATGTLVATGPRPEWLPPQVGYLRA